MEYEKVDAKAIKKGISRRNFLKDSMISAVIGTAAGLGTKEGLDYFGEKLSEIGIEADKKIKELGIDIQALSGSLERKLSYETQELKKHYTEGRLKIYEEIGIATPQELSQLEELIKNSEDFEKHYVFSERARIFKDRIDKRLLSLDDKAESMQPGFMRKLNDYMRDIAGKKTGIEGEKERDSIRKRLKDLCLVYDTNEDNRTAETEVLKDINKYLKTPGLNREEKELYVFLKEEYEKSGSKEQLRDFIENYDNYGERNNLLLKLRASLSDSEAIYSKINENKDYMQKLQGLLKDGIELKKDLRNRNLSETRGRVAEFDKEMDYKIKELREGVDSVISELENKGYEIDARKEKIDRGTFLGYFTKEINSLLKPINSTVSVGAGCLATLLAFNSRRKTRKKRTYQAGFEQVVERHNEMIDEINRLKSDNESLRKDLNKDYHFPGNDVY